MKSLVELDKSVTAQVDTVRSWGMIDIRLIVASKKPDAPDNSAGDADDEEPAEPADGTSPLDSYLERPKGKGYVVFLVNGQRHQTFD